MDGFRLVMGTPICITMGFQRWNMDCDVEYQYETFNGMPVYYGGDLYDSEDSDWDDPYALASAAPTKPVRDNLRGITLIGVCHQ